MSTGLDALAALLGDPRVAALTVTELNPLHGEVDGSTIASFADGIASACERWQAV